MRLARLGAPDTVASMSLDPSSQDGTSGDAPWLEDSARWSIRECPALEMRPGMFCFVPSAQTFLLVVSCTILKSAPPSMFVDLKNGKTLHFSLSDAVVVRIAC